MTSPRIYVACLAAYNAGRLHGVWIEAEQSPEDIWSEVADMLAVSPEPCAEEWAIHDHEGFGALQPARVGVVRARVRDRRRHRRARLRLRRPGSRTTTPAIPADLQAFEDAYRGEWRLAARSTRRTGPTDRPVRRRLRRPGRPTSGRGHRRAGARPRHRDVHRQPADGHRVYVFDPSHELRRTQTADSARRPGLPRCAVRGGAGWRRSSSCAIASRCGMGRAFYPRRRSRRCVAAEISTPSPAPTDVYVGVLPRRAARRRTRRPCAPRLACFGWTATRPERRPLRWRTFVAARPRSSVASGTGAQPARVLAPVASRPPSMRSRTANRRLAIRLGGGHRMRRRRPHPAAAIAEPQARSHRLAVRLELCDRRRPGTQLAAASVGALPEVPAVRPDRADSRVTDDPLLAGSAARLRRAPRRVPRSPAPGQGPAVPSTDDAAPSLHVYREPSPRLVLLRLPLWRFHLRLRRPALAPLHTGRRLRRVGRRTVLGLRSG